MNFECWPVRRCKHNTRTNEFVRLIKGGRGRGAVYSIESGVDGKGKRMGHKASGIIYLKS